MTDFYTKDKGTTYQDVLWETLKSLKEKASNEYRTPEKKLVVHGNWTETFKEGDSRAEFIQLVEFFSDIFIQEFDDDTMKRYTEIMKEVREMRDDVNSGKMDDEDYVIKKLDLMRELLRLIMVQLKDKQYMKGFGSIKHEEE